jgi:hypothetical protein
MSSWSDGTTRGLRIDEPIGGNIVALRPVGHR